MKLKRGGCVLVGGYKKIWLAPPHPLLPSKYSGYVYVHRLVAWDAGMMASPSDVVRHINRNKLDNRLENLCVIPQSEKPRRVRGIRSEICTPDGYLKTWMPAPHPLLKPTRPSGYVFSHRLVAWNGGLMSSPNDIVHHANGDRSDNRLENLRVFSSNGEHMRKEHVDGRLPHGYCPLCGRAGVKIHSTAGQQCCDHCYPEVRAAYQRRMASKYQPKNITCACCGRENMRHGGKGLCDACAKRQRRSGTLQYTRVTRAAVVTQ